MRTAYGRKWRQEMQRTLHNAKAIKTIEYHHMRPIVCGGSMPIHSYFILASPEDQHVVIYRWIFTSSPLLSIDLTP